MKKTLDNALQAAFEAGTRHGAGYPSTAAIPRGATRDAYKVWHRQWAGVPHEDPEPQPSDGPEYRDEHVAWQQRQQRREDTPHFQRGSEAGCYG